MLNRAHVVAIFAISLLSSLPTMAWATPPANCPTQSRASMKHFMEDVIGWLNTLNDNDATKLTGIQRYFNKDMEIQHNGRIIARSYGEFFKNQRLSRKFVDDVQTQLPLQRIIIDGEHVAIHTQARIQKRRKKPEIHQVIAIIEFKRCKISRWNEVSKKVRANNR